MRKMFVCAAVGFVLGIAVLLFGGMGRGQEARDANKGWIDYIDLKETDRLKERPGNYQVLGEVSGFFDRIYRVRPDYSECAYPLFLDSKTLATREDVDKWLDKGARRNKLRQFNIDIRSLTVHDAGEMEKSAELRKKLGRQFRQYRFLAVRRAHAGRAVVVLLTLDLSSLQSKKVEQSRGDNAILLYLVRSGDRWRVAWFDM